MHRYRVRLIVESFRWSAEHVIKNQIITLFKEDQNKDMDLSHLFTNYSELDKEWKMYASSFADDLFTLEEIIELVRLFGVRDDIQLVIGNRVKFPRVYDNSIGIVNIPYDSSTGNARFPKTIGLSFPLNAFVRTTRYFIDPEELHFILNWNGLSETQLRDKLEKL